MWSFPRLFVCVCVCVCFVFAAFARVACLRLYISLDFFFNENQLSKTYCNLKTRTSH